MTGYEELTFATGIAHGLGEYYHQHKDRSGMVSMVTQEQLHEVIKRIVENVHPKKVVLFGSYVCGRPSEDSDLDILVIKNMKMPRYKRAAEVRKYLRGLKMPIDLIVYTEEEVEEWKGVKAAFISQVMENGKVLYEQ